MNPSRSSSATSTATTDARVGADNGAIGVSSQGNVNVQIVPDEAFYLGEAAIEAVADIADGTTYGALSLSESVSRDAFDFADGTTYGALSLSESVSRDAFDFADEANYNALSFADRSGADAYDFAARSIDGARKTVSDVTGQFAEALAKTQEISRTESAQIAEQIIKIGLPAVALVFAVTQIWGKK